MFGRVLKSSIAKDNGRTEEFSTKKKKYEDKSRCFECGEEGHLSYQCPSNALGSRELPQRNKKSRKNDEKDEYQDDSLGAVIRYEQQQRSKEATNTSSSSTSLSSDRRKKFKPSSYFSDEEEFSD